MARVVGAKNKYNLCGKTAWHAGWGINSELGTMAPSSKAGRRRVKTLASQLGRNMNRFDDQNSLRARKPFVGMNGAAPETDDQQRMRFQVELEFVQCLANPNYLNFLAQRGYFKDSTFINYLKYLLYWKEPEYAKYLKYPMCLYFLDLLQYEHFRREVVNSQCTKFIDDQQILLWQHYTRRRTRLLQQAAEQVQQHNPQQNNGVAQPKVL